MALNRKRTALAGGNGGCCHYLQSLLQNSVRWTVLLILCLQNSLFTVMRRYSLGIVKEKYSKYELLLVGEIMKGLFSAYMVLQAVQSQRHQQQEHRLPDHSDHEVKHLTTSASGDASAVSEQQHHNSKSSSSTSSSSSLSSTDRNGFLITAWTRRLTYLISTSRKMMVLALIYGVMNILSMIALRNIGAGMFTIFAQCKILTTATCSSIMLGRSYSWTQWRALFALSLGVLLFSEPIWNGTEAELDNTKGDTSPLIGTVAVLVEVTLSGFASIYFEKVIKTDPLQLTIWERNFQLALGSVPVYVAFIVSDGGGVAGYGGGWSPLAWCVAALGAAGGLLVALSIKYGDSILKTLATTGSIVLSSVLDHVALQGPLTPSMMIAGIQVILAICNYTFDSTPPSMPPAASAAGVVTASSTHPSSGVDVSKSGGREDPGGVDHDPNDKDDEEIALMEKTKA